MNTLKAPIEKIAAWIGCQFDLSEDRASEQEIVKHIRKSLSLRGTNLWILIFAILICSIGLNVNSTAVVIGAMLISPLMGPILALGFGAAIYDFKLIRESLGSLLRAVVTALLSSAAYFAISPLSKANSELFSRTVPTIYDVFIAFLGGIVMIIAISRKSKSTNVIAGAAIATALMPPLCTAGYGLVNGNGTFFFGAFYLFIINAIYICLATFIIVRLMGFKRLSDPNPKMELRLRRFMGIIAIVALLPSTFIAYKMVKDEVIEIKIQEFIQVELLSKDIKILQQKIDSKSGKYFLHLVIWDAAIHNDLEASLKGELSKYRLSNVELSIEQASFKSSLPDLAEIKSGVLEEIIHKNEKRVANRDERIKYLEDQLAHIKSRILPANDILSELKLLYPQIERVVLVPASTNSAPTHDIDLSADASEDLFGLIEIKSRLADHEKNTIEAWLAIRTKTKAVNILFRPSSAPTSVQKEVGKKNLNSAKKNS